MQKFTFIDAAACRKIRDLIDTHLAALNEDTNLLLKCGAMSYEQDGSFATAKIEITLCGEDGTIVSKEERDFVACADAGYWEGIAAKDLDTRVFLNGNLVTIIGAKPRASKYPILCKKANGKVYKYRADAVAHAIDVDSKR